MRIKKLVFSAMIMLLAIGLTGKNPENRQPNKQTEHKANYRDVCTNSESAIDQSINNVRARLLGGGDCWWNLVDGSYIVPKVDPASGQRPVSSIFAGSVWLGGIDPAGNLKLACQDYRNDARNDFWPGPLTNEGLTEAAVCKNWDRHFRVTGEEILKHLANLLEGDLNPENIPDGLRKWPAKGNPYFEEEYGFELPFESQGLAGFFDANDDLVYNPLDGDYPSIEIRGCPLDRYPDEMIFWIYNDYGGGAPHARTGGKAIQMEIQVQAFGYTTNDELNDMTFQRYKLINRATEPIDSCFFAMWIDADLGCASDDFIGCDTAKSLMYIYNQDNQDGDSGCSCAGNVATYCDKVPILGVDYFRGPLRQTIDSTGSIIEEEIGMSSFTYYNNGSIGNPPAGTQDPSSPGEYYNYITGSWKDGRPYTFGGTGYSLDPSAVKVNYAFFDPPKDPTGWSMCAANVPFGDRRTLQASGPFRLNPTAVNELIIGAPWIPDVGACPDVEKIFRADKFAQGLFDNCFDLLDGPTAPDVDWVEMNQQVVAVLSNSAISNNFKEGYKELDFLAPDSIYKKPPFDTARVQYKFEGYRIYQLQNPNVSASDYDDPDVARIVYQVDVRNNVSKIFNWEEIEGLTKDKKYYQPVEEVIGDNKGIRHTFSIVEDKFAKGLDKNLVNHKKYYYSVIAYAHNNFNEFDLSTVPPGGQQRSYLEGRLNIKIYTVIPRPIVDRELNSVYGEGVVVTRLEGAGAGHNFLDLSDESRAAVSNFGSSFDSTLTYRPGRSPINVNIFNPLEVRDGEYEIALVDDNLSDKVLGKDPANANLQDVFGRGVRWELRQLPNGQVIKSERTLEQLNEQLAADYGFSVTIGQTGDAGILDTYGNTQAPIGTETSGALGIEYEYADPNLQWYGGIEEEDQGPLHFLKTGKLERDEELDRYHGMSDLGAFYPYYLADWSLGTPAEPWYITPAWTEKTGAATQGLVNKSAVGDVKNRRKAMANLPNVDIVLTSDKSKWSRCVVIEGAPYTFTGGQYLESPDFQPESPAGGKERLMFDVRYSLSVGKDDANGDGRPDPDGAVDAAGKPIYGMGWFPGYAIDVETGRRLNVFFSENSAFDNTKDQNFTGRDMLWNPTSQITLAQVMNPQNPAPYEIVAGGYHWIYVSYSTYDEGAFARTKFTPELNTTVSAKVNAIKDIAWAGMVTLQQGYAMKSLKDGLIPSDLRIKIRVDNPYQTWFDDANGGQKTGHPKYRFKIEGRETQPLDQVQVENALDSIKVTPNPYYGYSAYEVSQFQNIVKITNLPAKCTVDIFSLDGKFIRHYDRNETYTPYNQFLPDIEWDMKNAKGIPVASGVYLMNINAEGLGSRTIKWFGVARQFDPSGL